MEGHVAGNATHCPAGPVLHEWVLVSACACQNVGLAEGLPVTFLGGVLLQGGFLPIPLPWQGDRAQCFLRPA